MKLFKLLLPAALVCGAANASFIVYTEQGTVSGSFGGVGFTDATMTLVLTGDTSNVIEPVLRAVRERGARNGRNQRTRLRDLFGFDNRV